MPATKQPSRSSTASNPAFCRAVVDGRRPPRLDIQYTKWLLFNPAMSLIRAGPSTDCACTESASGSAVIGFDGWPVCGLRCHEQFQFIRLTVKYHRQLVALWMEVWMQRTNRGCSSLTSIGEVRFSPNGENSAVVYDESLKIELFMSSITETWARRLNRSSDVGCI